MSSSLNNPIAMFKLMMMASQFKEIINDKEKIISFLKNLDENKVKEIINNANILQQQLQNLKDNNS